jgi:hypothetical protein
MIHNIRKAAAEFFSRLFIKAFMRFLKAVQQTIVFRSSETAVPLISKTYSQITDDRELHMLAL